MLHRNETIEFMTFCDWLLSLSSNVFKVHVFKSRKLRTREVKTEVTNPNTGRGQAGDTSEKAKGPKAGCGELGHIRSKLESPCPGWKGAGGGP